ncbi:PEP-CTERM sorting domain-containing protein [Nitrosomonas ureae]|uniref:PEP-CTERM protein-sorting domain-containing protein n=1 Tax=Nitrosomonas ureae TaxID=44577 RepID=A0A286A4M8_9PROT|nr:PEP-CTERM sorting domain-containing protein [Nitrosomonas ureae]SOD16859.1 PEP-CTERM protein-sorting domain-containing protein [Nitrosomonas ureae]
MNKIIIDGFALGLMVLVSGVVSMAQASPVQWKSNGHHYDAIPFPEGITWGEAKIMAENSVYLGVNGHLATITSAAENSFIINALGGPSELDTFFLGGFQPVGSPEPEGNWQWVTGEPWSYTNWASGEPNDTYGGDGIIPLPDMDGANEEVLQFWVGIGRWNDVEELSYWGGLIVEYPTAPIPEPQTYAMLLAGLGLLGFMVRRRKESAI